MATFERDVASRNHNKVDWQVLIQDVFTCFLPGNLPEVGPALRTGPVAVGRHSAGLTGRRCVPSFRVPASRGSPSAVTITRCNRISTRHGVGSEVEPLDRSANANVLAVRGWHGTGGGKGVVIDERAIDISSRRAIVAEHRFVVSRHQIISRAASAVLIVCVEAGIEMDWTASLRQGTRRLHRTSRQPRMMMASLDRTSINRRHGNRGPNRHR